MTDRTDILIIDDEKGILDSLSEFFLIHGIPNDKSNDPREGLRKAIAGHYKVVLVDIVMPHLNGLEVLEKIKEDRPQMEVVMMTANATLAKVTQARKLGAADFILKPFADMEEINRIINLSLERSKRWISAAEQSLHEMA